jgi:FkbM family methyltransferase
MSNIERIKNTLNESDELTDRFIDSLIQLEKDMNYPFRNVRDSFTGLLSDELFKGRYFTKTLQNGLKIKFQYNSKIAREFLLSSPKVPDHVWEPQTTKLLKHFSSNTENVIIGGAYFGDHALILADLMRNTGICHAFEPNSGNCSLIRENAKLNQIDNLQIMQMALWDKSGEKLQFEGEDALASTVPASAGDKDIIDTITLDDYIANKKIEKVGLLMIDVEGGEMRVLQGAARLLTEKSPVVIFENHGLHNDWSNGLQQSDSVKLMSDLGYTVFSVRDFHNNIQTEGMPIELIPVDRTFIEGPPHGFNLLAVKNKTLVDDSLFRIVYDYSPKLLLDKKQKEFHPAV